MAISPGTHTVGPNGSTLNVNTYRDGVAAKIGHDLVIEVTKWEATVDVGPDGSVNSVSLSADPGSLKVVSGEGGAKPLSDKDRADIKTSIGDKVLGSSPITFQSNAASMDGSGRMHVEGELAIAGTSKPAVIDLDADPGGTVGGTIKLTQTDYGIKPYKAMMGALKVRDDVEIVLAAQLPTS
jgi:hypothetical protein